MHCLMLILTLALTSQCIVCHVITTQTGHGYHCRNVTQEYYRREVDDGDSADETLHDHCVPCYFPQNCLDNNTCAPGTWGMSCEKCDHRQTSPEAFHRVGNHCVACFSDPWSILSFGVFIVILVLISVVNGFSVSVCTKIKIVVHFCQLLLLTFMLKIPWPDLIPQTMYLMSFAFSNADFLAIECLYPNLSSSLSYYIKWLSSLLPPVLALVFMVSVDKSLALLLSREKDQDRKLRRWRHRTMLRRVTFYLLVVMYMPVTISGAQSNSCSHSTYQISVLDTSRNTFLHDQDLDCDRFGLATIQFLAMLILVIYSIALPLTIILFTLRQRKWELLDEEKLKYGPVYESYKSRYCFWEAIPMLRKAIHIAMTETNVISISVQIMIQLVLTGVYLLAIIVFRPYSECHWKDRKLNVNLMLDVMANFMVGFLQTIALLRDKDMYLEKLTYVFLSCLVGVLVIALGLLLFIPKEDKAVEVFEIPWEGCDESGQENTDGTKYMKRFKNKVAPAPSRQETLKQAKRNLEF